MSRSAACPNIYIVRTLVPTGRASRIMLGMGIAENGPAILRLGIETHTADR